MIFIDFEYLNGQIVTIVLQTITHFEDGHIYTVGGLVSVKGTREEIKTRIINEVRKTMPPGQPVILGR